VAALDPFRAVLYASSIDPASVTTPPYDVISGAERQRLESLHPHNLIRVILGTDQEGDGPGADKYSRAAALLRAWLTDGVLVGDDRPRLYAYRMSYTWGGAERVTGGVIGALGLETFAGAEGRQGGGGIFPHERVLPKPRSDRLDLTRAAMANLEPIWLIGGEGLVGPALASAAARPALVDFRDPDAVRHQLWPLTDAEAAPLAGGIPTPLVIADGHHRYSASLALRDELRAERGPGPWDATLALVSDPTEEPPALLPIYRLTSLSVDDVAARGSLAAFDGDVAALAAAVAERGPGTIGVASPAGCWTMAIDPPSLGVPDTAWIARHLLEPASADVTYEHDLALVAEAVAAGSVALLPAPIPIAAVVDTALAGMVMPPKSTLFWPKPRTGILLRDFQRP
jgi:uncharacterized protein (DUF1015 family)